MTISDRKLWRKDANLATPDHNVPTDKGSFGIKGITDPIALTGRLIELRVLRLKLDIDGDGTAHVVGPEQGCHTSWYDVCGDSHTSHRATSKGLALLK